MVLGEESRYTVQKVQKAGRVYKEKMEERVCVVMDKMRIIIGDRVTVMQRVQESKVCCARRQMDSLTLGYSLAECARVEDLLAVKVVARSCWIGKPTMTKPRYGP